MSTKDPVSPLTHTSPQKNGIRPSENQDSISSEDVAHENSLQNEKCCINQANYRKRHHSQVSAGTHRLSLSLTAKQKAVFAAAIRTRSGVSPSNKNEGELLLKSASRRARQQVHPRKQQKTLPKQSPLKVNKSIDLPAKKDPVVSRLSYEDLKREHRREQGRKSQTAYRERQRQIEPRLMREIYALKDEVKKLEGLKTMHGGCQGKQQTDPIQTIRDVYYAIDCRLNQQQTVDAQKYEQTYGCSPALQYLLDLQREEFDSTASLELHWSWYRTQFRVFELSVTSFERVEAAEHVIIQVKGSLRLGMYRDGNTARGTKAGNGELVCPVRHLFEFEKCEPGVIRITSEVDLVGAVVASQMRSGLGCARSVLNCLSEGFSFLNRN